jgi:hypothetical protein
METKIMHAGGPSGKGVINLKEIFGRASINGVEETEIEKTVHSKCQSGHRNLLNLITSILFLLIFPALIVAQETRVVTFNHTLRWETESKFPNYFLIRQVRDSIFSGIKKDLIQKLNVADVSFPDKVEYRIITGFGKPKNELSKNTTSSGYDVDIFSFISRKTAGYAVEWSVNVVIRKDGKVILSKEATHEIENSNAAAYMTDLRWMTPRQFQDILHGLIREAIGMESAYSGKIVIGSLEEQEREVHSWFPNSTRYLLKVNGAMQKTDNFAAFVVNNNDTVLHLVYKNKMDIDIPTVSLKPIFADLFTGITGLGTTYTIKEKERRRGTIEFSNGLKLLIQLDWIDEITSSTMTDGVEIHTVVPLVGQIFMDKVPIGNFIYENISQVLSQGEAKEKFSLVSGSYTENSLGTAVIHRITGVLNNRKFTAEYNELFGMSDIKSENETLASMVFQNCNPENLQSFDKQKISKNKLFVTSSSSNMGTPSMKKGTAQEWYPLFIKENSKPEEIVTSLEILVCLFFGMGNM